MPRHIRIFKKGLGAPGIFPQWGRVALLDECGGDAADDCEGATSLVTTEWEATMQRGWLVGKLAGINAGEGGHIHKLAEGGIARIFLAWLRLIIKRAATNAADARVGGTKVSLSNGFDRVQCRATT
ncbi:MAG TPA: hypothetical protein VM144_07090 [Aestuariivirga sp.]|nr:hypothetical protein [Aestuariivirga sp.]